MPHRPMLALALPFFLLALLAVPCPLLTADEGSEGAADGPPVELGAVAWLRSFDTGAARAKAEQKPILLLFQEVPGWGTCKRYGGQVLAHPLTVDGIEALFVPVAIYNNTKDDEDAATRERFEEPSWNNPVVRVVDAEGKDVVGRHAGDYTTSGLLRAMREALEARKTDVPAWFDLLQREAASRKRGVEQAVFGMTWFWVGEARLASIDGVVQTRPGWLAKREVVEVMFDPEVVPYAKLVEQATAKECATPVFARTEAQLETARELAGERATLDTGEVKTDDDKFYLSRSILKHLPLTPMQASRVNALVGEHEDPTPLLAPSQRALLERIRKVDGAGWPVAIGVPLLEAWKAVPPQ